MPTSYLVAVILLIVGGLFAAPGLVAGKNPDVDNFFKKASPYLGFLGVFMLAYGVYIAIQVITNFGLLLELSVLATVTLAAGALLMLALGYLHAYSLIHSFMGKGEAEATSQEVYARINKKKASVGIAGIVIGIWWLIAYNL